MTSLDMRRRQKVLIVEDNEENLAVYTTILTHHGYEVVEAVSGEDALIKARTESPDIITMDVGLPGIDGFETTRILKSDPTTKQIPIIALTAHALEADRSRAIEAGMDGYLAKPVEPRRVVQELERFLGPSPFGSDIFRRYASDTQANASRAEPRASDSTRPSGAGRDNDRSITVSFAFPEHVRTPCEQYLLYFAEFLKDVGIRATADLRHEAGEVLFSVKPEDPETALKKVHRALAIYLRLPDDPVLSHALETAGHDVGDIRALQLLANIQILHAQLTYARATLEAKNETIEALQGRIADTMSLNRTPVTLGSGSQDERIESPEKVELLGGAVELVPWEGKGLRIDTARIFRWFKSWIESDH